MKPLIILTGPTAVGKTELSIALAKSIGGEIISADSMQVYKYMDIGTAKIRSEEMDGVPHHLIDILEPDVAFNVAMFKDLAKSAVEDIYSRGRIPILVGGTGFYIQALLYDIDFSEEDSDSSIRKELETLAEVKGAAFLHEKLREVDPESAEQIHANNVKRVIRALEYYQLHGEKISTHNETERHKESPYDFLYFVLTHDRQVLYERIEKRIDQMIDHGLISEVDNLLKKGYDSSLVSMQGLGYKELIPYLQKKCTLDEAIYVLKRDTRHFAKRQLTWFRRERNVRWLDKSLVSSDEEILKEILNTIDREWSLQK
ncbi:tRNA (adenosine(37)-N6)-dimethylallyltransferase MiaA [Frisingicoccus caecimuris]|uniref:tRNA dimethylallyltransferase n=1 Tax=Frisingicoccus caecimuris TaxID=1796636 RepID=A0A4R2LCY1_9FIRM|nr:tRNA (adenosine(37)-N6)-dimethylallyltransferase MiaA [Frisingicoccus caecimuris]MCR1918657.1 tRNA (adenosine(37)-N6)-dimethylallyltransferase MiaA [Frisingicoccus caecimuris]TCO86289.1 tRNA dimethylallyltransferase [Frisingicoccus caecimuris]